MLYSLSIDRQSKVKIIFLDKKYIYNVMDTHIWFVEAEGILNVTAGFKIQCMLFQIERAKAFNQRTKRCPDLGLGLGIRIFR